MTWWSDAVGYEVYLRSFADGNGDGIGDLVGLRSRLDHLEWLGVDVVWVTPFYPSPMVDHGYDVADYCDVDPLFGTLDDFDGLVADAGERGLRLMVDLVPNHTSDLHPWFVDARSAPDAARRDWYVWRDPAPGGGPPNNWVSHFGGPAWTLDSASGQYYMHLFLPEQPDLNWANPAVVEAFDDVLRFWLDRGVAGFRIDVAHSLVEDQSFRDNPVRRPVTTAMSPREAFWSFDHDHDIDQPGVVDVYRRWNTIARPYGAALLGEVYLTDARRIARYVEAGALDLSFHFQAMHIPWEASAIRAMLRDATDAAGSSIAWVQCSHDEPRSVSRFGGGDAGRERALALATLYAGLPGMPFLYQGEELGLDQGVVPPELSADPVGTRNANPSGSRDGCRTPMPWEPGDGLGFTAPGVTPWLPFGGRAAGDTVAVQRADPRSWLSRYRALVGARHALGPAAGELRWSRADDAGDPVIAYERGSVLVAANVGDGPATVDVGTGTGTHELIFSTWGEPVPGGSDVAMPPRSAMIVDRSP